MAFDQFKNWTGASGAPIGFADAYPEDKYSAFTADPIHGQDVNPNTPNSYAQVGNYTGDGPLNIQGDPNDFIDYGMGANGFMLDDIPYPGHDDNAGTDTDTIPLGPAKRAGRDPAHGQHIYQDFQAPGHGVNFYGSTIETEDLHAWNSERTPNQNTGTYPADAREKTTGWPVAFDSTTVAPLLPVVRDTEHIPMYRMQQDDRPLYRYLAVTAHDIVPSGSVYNPQTNSNVYLQNVKPIPAAARTPIDPAASQNVLSDSIQEDGEYIDVGYWQ